MGFLGDVCWKKNKPVGKVYIERIELAIDMGGWDSSVGTAPDLGSKGCEFESRQEWRENFLFHI